jgi:hypothetical protein
MYFTLPLRGVRAAARCRIKKKLFSSFDFRSTAGPEGRILFAAFGTNKFVP